MTDPVIEAQKRLAKACMGLPMTPNGAAISAFVNNTLLASKVDALVEYTAPFELNEEGTPIMRGTFEEILVKHLTMKAEHLEQTVQEAPRIIAGVAGHG